MNEAFHVSSMEWQYHPRERAIIHTLHLAQLPAGMNAQGDAIPVPPVPDDNKGFGRFGVPPLQLPAAPSMSASIFNTFNQFVSSSVYGCVGTTQAILAQRNCGISIDFWTNTLLQVTMNPNKGGKYLIHLECQTDLRTLGYQGPDGLGQCNGEVFIDGDSLSAGSSSMQIEMLGSGWDSNLYIESVGHSSTTFISSVLGAVVFKGNNLGDPSAAVPAHISCFIMKIDAP